MRTVYTVDIFFFHSNVVEFLTFLDVVNGSHSVSQIYTDRLEISIVKFWAAIYFNFVQLSILNIIFKLFYKKNLKRIFLTLKNK